MKKTVRALMLVLVLAPLLLGCVPRPHISLDRGPAVSEEAEPVSLPTRESVYLYGDKSLPNRLTLSFSGEPRLLASGYARLAGVVSGQRRTACVEIGGRGLALEKGEMVDAYRITGIESDHVVLEKK